MTIHPPPLGTRLRFWLLGLRLPEQHRPWVAQQIVAPGYGRRRFLGLIVLQLAFVVIPQSLMALAEHSWWRLVLPGALLLVYAVSAPWANRLSDAQRRRLLGYHGVTADGRLTTPVSALGSNPLGRAGLALLTAQVLVFSSGVAVAADRLSEQHRCQPVPAADLAAVSALVGRPAPAVLPEPDGSPPPRPVDVRSTRLLHAKRVSTSLAGMYYVAAYVQDTSGRLVGPGVWRIVEPHTTFELPTRNVSAANRAARAITPNSGYGYAPDPDADAAARCARRSL